MFNRRHFVVTTGIGILAGGFGIAQLLGARQNATASASSISTKVAVPATGSDAMAAMPGMAGMAAPTGPTNASSFVYHGHSVKLTEGKGSGLLSIDGRPPIHLERPEAGKLHTHLLPFSLYDDPQTLVRDVLESARLGLFVI